jgi:two-component system, cell cycle sensor histidine kinase DivJ
VHPSVRADALTAARHRTFIASRLLGGFLAFALLPLFLVLRKAPEPLEVVVFAWLMVPIGVAYFLSRTGRYEAACVLSALALVGLITGVGAMTGGSESFAAAWLVVVPVEAALSGSRRVAVAAAGLALGGLGVLLAAGADGIGLFAFAREGASSASSGAAIGSAVAYVTLLAFGTGALARTGSALLAEEEEPYRLLAAHMTDVITRHDRTGRVRFVSPAAERLLRVPARELMGQGLFERVHVGDRPAYLTALSDAARSQESSVEFRLRPNLGPACSRMEPQFIWVEMCCRAVEGPGTQTNGDAGDVVAVMREVTRRKAQEIAIEAARSEAEEANAAKSRFLATMSHELRTPLNAVIGFSEMLVNESGIELDPAKRLDYARLIHDSGHHLLSVVNLVLDMSKIESGNFVITPEPVATAAVIRGCAELLALKAREAGLDLIVRLPGELPEIVADKRAIKQMLLNLLSNAIKFTEPGGQVTVSAAMQGSEVAICVEDTGVGISKEDLPRIGEAFFQACGAYNRPYDGTGLGLSIVKGLVGLHGGRMEIGSLVGEGTRVTLVLPLDCESRTRHAPAIEHARSAVVELMPLAVNSTVRIETQVKKRA